MASFFSNKYIINVALFILGLIFTFVQVVALGTSDGVKIAIVPVLMFILLVTIAFPILLSSIFIISSFFIIGLPAPAWSFLGFPDLILPLFLLIFLSNEIKNKTGYRSHAVLSITHWMFVLFVFSAISLLTHFGTYNVEALLRGIIFLFHMIELPIALLLLSVWYRCVTTKLDIIAISAIFVFQSSLVFYQYLFQGAIMPGGTYHHHGMIGNVMTISLGWHIALFFKAKTKTPKILYAVLSLVALLAILFSESRSSLVGIGISALLFIALHFRLNKMYIFSLLFSLVFAYLLLQYSPLQQTIDRTFNSSPAGLDPSSLGRILIWKGGWNYFVNAPLLIKLFGHGIGQYITVPYEFWVEMGRLTSGAHNNLLHVLIETGIVGLIVFIIVFIKILSELWKIREINLFAKYMFYSTIALLASGLTQETFWFQNSFGSFWLFYICCLSIAFAQNKQFLESDKSSA